MSDWTTEPPAEPWACVVCEDKDGDLEGGYWHDDHLYAGCDEASACLLHAREVKRYLPIPPPDSGRTLDDSATDAVSDVRTERPAPRAGAAEPGLWCKNWDAVKCVYPVRCDAFCPSRCPVSAPSAESAPDAEPQKNWWCATCQRIIPAGQSCEKCDCIDAGEDIPESAPVCGVCGGRGEVLDERYHPSKPVHKPCPACTPSAADAVCGTCPMWDCSVYGLGPRVLGDCPHCGTMRFDEDASHCQSHPSYVRPSAAADTGLTETDFVCAAENDCDMAEDDGECIADCGEPDLVDADRSEDTGQRGGDEGAGFDWEHDHAQLRRNTEAISMLADALTIECEETRTHRLLEIAVAVNDHAHRAVPASQPSESADTGQPTGGTVSERVRASTDRLLAACERAKATRERVSGTDADANWGARKDGHDCEDCADRDNPDNCSSCRYPWTHWKPAPAPPSKPSETDTANPLTDPIPPGDHPPAPRGDTDSDEVCDNCAKYDIRPQCGDCFDGSGFTRAPATDSGEGADAEWKCSHCGGTSWGEIDDHGELYRFCRDCLHGHPRHHTESEPRSEDSPTGGCVVYAMHHEDGTTVILSDDEAPATRADLDALRKDTASDAEEHSHHIDAAFNRRDKRIDALAEKVERMSNHGSVAQHNSQHSKLKARLAKIEERLPVASKLIGRIDALERAQDSTASDVRTVAEALFAHSHEIDGDDAVNTCLAPALFVALKRIAEEGA